jgi:pimeloyl-ACP methyl ester carboxylesterase
MSNMHYVKKLLTFTLLLFPQFTFGQIASKFNYGSNAEAGHYATLNGIKIYYEEYGTGVPLVVLHGNGGNIAFMTPQIEYFAKKYRVIAMDCRGRGKSELGNDSLTYVQMMNDVNLLLDYLHIDSTYIIGRSDGAIIALLLGIYYPQRAIKIAAFGANLNPGHDAFYDDDEISKEREHAERMLAIHDTTENWYLIRQRYRLMEFQPSITPLDLQKIKCPVLVLACDRDMIREEHSLNIYRSIPKSNLCFFNGETHDISVTNPLLFNTTIEKYFSEPYKDNKARK